MASIYFVRGMILAAQPPAAPRDESVELVAVLDQDAAQTAADELAKVRRLYEREVRKRGQEIVWFAATEALLAPKVESKQLLFTLPGVEVFELQQLVLAQ